MLSRSTLDNFWIKDCVSHHFQLCAQIGDVLQCCVVYSGFTRMLSKTGLWPEPPPTFSGLKVTSGWHMNAGFRLYPHCPFCRNLPWFRSICSPGVWKFKATGKKNNRIWQPGTYDKWLLTIGWERIPHQSDSLHSTYPEGCSLRTGGAVLKGRSCSACDCCDGQN